MARTKNPSLVAYEIWLSKRDVKFMTKAMLKENETRKAASERIIKQAIEKEKAKQQKLFE
jgi:hypothetical protein